MSGPLIFLPFYRQGYGHTQRLRTLPKNTQLVKADSGLELKLTEGPKVLTMTLKNKQKTKIRLE